MRNATLTFAALALGAVALPTAAFATDCPVIAKDQWLTVEQITAKAADLGYQVRQVDTEDGCYEIYGIKDGGRFEVYLHPATGEVVKVKAED